MGVSDQLSLLLLLLLLCKKEKASVYLLTRDGRIIIVNDYVCPAHLCHLHAHMTGTQPRKRVHSAVFRVGERRLLFSWTDGAQLNPLLKESTIELILILFFWITKNVLFKIGEKKVVMELSNRARIAGRE